MDSTERDLVTRFWNGYTLTVTINGHVLPMLYDPLYDGDPLPWINGMIGPSLRFPNDVVTVHTVVCIACGTEASNGYRKRADFPAVDLCEDCAVAELAGDVTQYMAGTLKISKDGTLI